MTRVFIVSNNAIPAGSRSKSIIEKAVHLDLFRGNVVLSCDEAEARNLLLYAGHCPGVIASIHKAFRDAGLALTTIRCFRRRFDVSAEAPASLAAINVNSKKSSFLECSIYWCSHCCSCHIVRLFGDSPEALVA